MDDLGFVRRLGDIEAEASEEQVTADSHESESESVAVGETETDRSIAEAVGEAETDGAATAVHKEVAPTTVVEAVDTALVPWMLWRDSDVLEYRLPVVTDESCSSGATIDYGVDNAKPNDRDGSSIDSSDDEVE